MATTLIPQPTNPSSNTFDIDSSEFKVIGRFRGQPIIKLELNDPNEVRYRQGVFFASKTKSRYNETINPIFVTRAIFNRDYGQDAKANIKSLVQDPVTGQNRVTVIELIKQAAAYDKIQSSTSTFYDELVSIVKFYENTIDKFPMIDSEVENLANEPRLEGGHPLLSDQKQGDAGFYYMPQLLNYPDEELMMRLLQPLTPQVMKELILSPGSMDRPALNKLACELIRRGIQRQCPVNLFTVLGFQILCRSDSLGTLLRILVFSATVGLESAFLFQNSMLESIYKWGDDYLLVLPDNIRVLTPQKVHLLKPFSRTTLKKNIEERVKSDFSIDALWQ